MPLLNFDQRSPEWFAARKGMLTASTAAACLGMNPWMSRQAAWRSIMGLDDPQNNKHMQYGTDNEKLALSVYECETGNLVVPTSFWTHSTIPWLGASPDGLVGKDGLVEIKCLGKHPGKVPLHYHLQMLVQLIVTGRAWCDFFVWHPDWTFLARVDTRGTAGLIHRLSVFHEMYVKTGIEPPKKTPKRRKRGRNS